MRLGRVERAKLPGPELWPPILAVRGPGGRSEGHAHHAMHAVLAVEGELRVRCQGGPWRRAAGVLTGPDVPHAIDAAGVEVLLVFVDPESEVGGALRGAFAAAVRLMEDGERRRLVGVDPMELMGSAGDRWTREVAAVVGAQMAAPRRVHPRVRSVIRRLRELPAGADTSLESLAREVKLSPGRLMHAFTESVGIPLRPYLQWLKLQRAAAAIAGGAPLADAAYAAGFADAAHMSRTFRRMFGVPPSSLRPRPPR